jgi:hypothetical protein
VVQGGTAAISGKIDGSEFSWYADGEDLWKNSVTVPQGDGYLQYSWVEADDGIHIRITELDADMYVTNVVVNDYCFGCEPDSPDTPVTPVTPDTPNDYLDPDYIEVSDSITHEQIEEAIERHGWLKDDREVAQRLFGEPTDPKTVDGTMVLHTGEGIDDGLTLIAANPIVKMSPFGNRGSSVVAMPVIDDDDGTILGPTCGRC